MVFFALAIALGPFKFDITVPSATIYILGNAIAAVSTEDMDYFVFR